MKKKKKKSKLKIQKNSSYFLFELFDDVVDVVLKRSLPSAARAAAARAASASAAAAAAACCRLNTSDCSRRSSSSFISGLLMSLGLPVPNMLDTVVDVSPAWLIGTVRGKRLSGLRPSAIDDDEEDEMFLVSSGLLLSLPSCFLL